MICSVKCQVFAEKISLLLLKKKESKQSFHVPHIKKIESAFNAVKKNTLYYDKSWLLHTAKITAKEDKGLMLH